MNVLLPLNKYGTHAGMHPNSRANLSKPGETHNHRGGPQISLLDLLRQELKKIPLKGLDGADNIEHLNNAQLICQRYMEKVVNGDAVMMRDLLDRINGKPAQIITGAGGGPVEVVQTIRHITQEELRPTLEALVGAGVVTISRN